MSRPVLTPSQLNALARDLLEGAFPLIWVEGELSGVSRPASGHLYFTLKDARAQVRGALFKPKTQWLKFRPADGMQVVLRARLTLYEPRGEYQLIVEHMEEAGEGALLRAFEALKARLAAEGLFDAQRKRTLPRFVRRLGVLTSPSGAAVRDVLSILRRRFPLLEVDLLPVPVQGTTAPPLIADALARADRSGRYDVLLLARGGGSLEDLAAFNDEGLARAIGASRTPVVSAVGHESDVSIADFVADLRAATPSAAAELLVPDRGELAALLQRRRQLLAAAWRRVRDTGAQRADQLQQRLQAQHPAARLQRGAERLARLRRSLSTQLGLARQRAQLRVLLASRRLASLHPRTRVAADRQRLGAAGTRQRTVTVQALEQRTRQLRALGRALNAVSPLATIERGFAILLDADDGRVIRRVGDTGAGSRVRARLADGELQLRVDASGRAPD